jgi:hypothetical protein
LIGGGIVPPAVGYWAERFSFSSGFAFLGIFFLALFPLFLGSAQRLKITAEREVP